MEAECGEDAFEWFFSGNNSSISDSIFGKEFCGFMLPRI